MPNSSRMFHTKRAGPIIPLEKRWGTNPKPEKIKILELDGTKEVFMSGLKYLIMRAKADRRVGEIVKYRGIKFKLAEDDDVVSVIKRYIRINGYGGVKFKK